MVKTVFEKVIFGEFEGSFVYRDEICVSFMDLNPLNPGHVLVVPRQPVQRLSSLTPQTAAHLFEVAQKILKAIEQSEVKIEGANIFLSDGEVAGQEVPHVHLHILPRFADDGIKLTFGKSFRKESRAELDRIAKLISDKISRSLQISALFDPPSKICTKMRQGADLSAYSKSHVPHSPSQQV